MSTEDRRRLSIRCVFANSTTVLRCFSHFIEPTLNSAAQDNSILECTRGCNLEKMNGTRPQCGPVSDAKTTFDLLPMQSQFLTKERSSSVKGGWHAKGERTSRQVVCHAGLVDQTVIILRSKDINELIRAIYLVKTDPVPRGIKMTRFRRVPKVTMFSNKPSATIQHLTFQLPILTNETVHFTYLSMGSKTMYWSFSSPS